MAIDWAIMLSCPYDGNRFSFQRMDDKVKDRLVLSVVQCGRDTSSSLGLYFSFGCTIKGGMDQQLDLGESSGLGVVHTCQIQHQLAPKKPLDLLEQTSFTYDFELEVNGGSND